MRRGSAWGRAEAAAVTPTLPGVREYAGLQLGVPADGHSMASCSSCLCRAWSRLTTRWWTASSPSLSSSRSSRRTAVRTLFWGHRESLGEQHACEAGRPPTPRHTRTSREQSLQEGGLAGNRWRLWQTEATVVARVWHSPPAGTSYELTYLFTALRPREAGRQWSRGLQQALSNTHSNAHVLSV